MKFRVFRNVGVLVGGRWKEKEEIKRENLSFYIMGYSRFFIIFVGFVFFMLFKGFFYSLVFFR